MYKLASRLYGEDIRPETVLVKEGASQLQEETNTSQVLVEAVAQLEEQATLESAHKEVKLDREEKVVSEDVARMQEAPKLMQDKSDG